MNVLFALVLVVSLIREALCVTTHAPLLQPPPDVRTACNAGLPTNYFGFEYRGSCYIYVKKSVADRYDGKFECAEVPGTILVDGHLAIVTNDYLAHRLGKLLSTNGGTESWIAMIRDEGGSTNEEKWWWEELEIPANQTWVHYAAPQNIYKWAAGYPDGNALADPPQCTVLTTTGEIKNVKCTTAGKHSLCEYNANRFWERGKFKYQYKGLKYWSEKFIDMSSAYRKCSDVNCTMSLVNAPINLNWRILSTRSAAPILDDCSKLCIRFPTCESFVFHKGTKECRLQYVWFNSSVSLVSPPVLSTWGEDGQWFDYRWLLKGHPW